MLTPTLKAAQTAAEQVGAAAHSVAWLLHQWGYRWDEDGHWAQVQPTALESAHLARGDLVVVDEAGMLDQDTARALLELTDHLGVRVALVGDRHQLPAVGRGGVLDLAERYAPDCHVDLESIRRFTDPAYADLSRHMRRGTHPEDVFDALAARGHIVIHPSHVERDDAVTRLAAQDPAALVIADTRDQVAHLNALIRDRRAAAAAGDVHTTDGIVTDAGALIGIGDRIATRRNDPRLGVANRQTWTVLGQDTDGGLSVRGRAGARHLPTAYVTRHVELAYTTTAYGAQGETVETAHAVLGEHTTDASAYVAMTRGRASNTAHLVAADTDEARRQWAFMFGRDRADLGPAQAAQRASEDLDRYGPMSRRREQEREHLAARAPRRGAGHSR